MRDFPVIARAHNHVHIPRIKHSVQLKIDSNINSQNIWLWRTKHSQVDVGVNDVKAKYSSLMLLAKFSGYRSSVPPQYMFSALMYCNVLVFSPG